MSNTNTTDITNMTECQIEALLGYEPTVEEILEDCKAARMAVYSAPGGQRLIWAS